MGINSYAQNFEDVMLWRALSQVERGLYIDIGAQDPIVDSISLAFHERGWHGIHLEPIPQYADSLKQHRPGDVVIQAAVGSGPSIMSFFEIAGTGLSTADPTIASRHKSSGFSVTEISVPCIPLAAVFDRAVGREIHWLKIDVEGFEYQVLSSWAPSLARPWVVVIESTLPLTQIESHDAWEPLLFGLGYKIAYFDGLNRFYVSSAHGDLMKSLSVPPNTFDDFTLNGTASAPFHRRIQALNDIKVQTAETELRDLKEKIESDRLNTAALQTALSQDLKQKTREVEDLTILLNHKEAELVAKLSAVQRDSLLEWQQQEVRHATSRSEVATELAQLRSRVGDLLTDAANREARTIEQLRQDTVSTRSREQIILREFRDSESNLVEKLAALQTAHLQHIDTIENNARIERQASSARSDQSNRELHEAFARERNLIELLAVARGEINAIRRKWWARLIFAARSESTSASATIEPRITTDPPARSKDLIEPAPTTFQMPHMNQHLDASKPARSVDELLKFNDFDFVQCAYLSILGRPADPEGLANYLQHVRRGADRLELIQALATSTEGALRDSSLLPGLRSALQRAGQNRPSFISRHIAGPITRSLRSLFSRMDVCEYRLGKLEDNIQLRLEAMEKNIMLTVNARSETVNDDDKEAIDKLSSHAQSIYQQFKGKQKTTPGKPT